MATITARHRGWVATWRGGQYIDIGRPGEAPVACLNVGNDGEYAVRTQQDVARELRAWVDTDAATYAAQGY